MLLVVFDVFVFHWCVCVCRLHTRVWRTSCTRRELEKGSRHRNVLSTAMSRGSCHVMVVSDRYRAQTGYQTSRIHSFSTLWSSGSNVTIAMKLKLTTHPESERWYTSIKHRSYQSCHSEGHVNSNNTVPVCQVAQSTSFMLHGFAVGVVIDSRYWLWLVWH